MSKRKPSKAPAKALLPPAIVGAKTKRLNLRLTEEDYEQLLELRLALHLGSDSQTIRALIRLHHAAEREAVRRVRRDPTHAERLQALVDGRQLILFGGDHHE